jgi:starch synthase (maltosyl-transferring)
MPLPPHNGRRRAVIEDVYPQVDSGRHPIYRVVGDEVVVTAAIFADGKDEVAARLLFRYSDDHRWSFASMHATGKDLWSGSFRVDKLGYWRYSLLAWIDPFATWTSELRKRIAAQKDPANAESISNSVAGLRVGSKLAAQDVALVLRSGADPGGRTES